jgi:hypothetical protein
MSSFASTVSANRRAVLALSDPELVETLSVLRQIRKETARSLADFLSKADGASTYTIHKHRALLAQLDDSIRLIETKLPPALLSDLRTPTLGRTALKNLMAMVEAGEKEFRGAITSLNLPVAKILRDFDQSVVSRYAKSATRYAGDVGELIRKDLTLGLVKGDTIDQLASRLVGTNYRALVARGVDAVAGAAADKMFFSSHADAARLVRTEWNNAYNQTQILGLKSAADKDPKAGFLKKWDAANDKMTCEDCHDMDDVAVELDDDFPNDGGDGPPLHPNDRCAIVPWSRAWGKTNYQGSAAA